MAEDKLTRTDLRKAISKQMSLPEETAIRFLAAIVPSIMEGLKTDGQVRINGLGTFKLVKIAPRKSVNINTGENIVLDGYNKVTFVPESYIREQINEPFADLEAVRVDENGQPLDPESTLPGVDPRERFDEQANEIKGILEEMNKLNQREPKKPKEAPKPETPEVPKEPKKPAKPAAPKKPKEEPKKAPAPDEPGKYHGWIVALVTILILLVMLIVSYFVLVNRLENWANHLGEQSNEAEFLRAQEEAEMLDIEPLLPFDSTAPTVDSAVVPEENEVAGEDTTYQPTIIAIETVKDGSRLAQIARRYYGDPDEWVVIYEENKEVIKDPNNLRSGTKLRIPKLQ